MSLHPLYWGGLILSPFGVGVQPSAVLHPWGGGYLQADICYRGSKNTLEEEEGSMLGLCLAAASLGVGMKPPALTPLRGDSCGGTAPGSSEFPYGGVFWEAPASQLGAVPPRWDDPAGFGIFLWVRRCGGTGVPQRPAQRPLGVPSPALAGASRRKGEDTGCLSVAPPCLSSSSKALGASPRSRKGLWICSSPSPATP